MVLAIRKSNWARAERRNTGEVAENSVIAPANVFNPPIRYIGYVEQEILKYIAD